MTAWDELVEFANRYLDPDSEPVDDPYGTLETVANWIVAVGHE